MNTISCNENATKQLNDDYNIIIIPFVV